MKTDNQLKRKAGKVKTRRTNSAATGVLPRKDRGGKAGRTKSAPAGIGTISPSKRSFDVRRFCTRFRLVRPDLTRMTGYSLRSVDKWAAGEKPGVATRRRLRELERLVEGLGEIMEPAYVGDWLKTPNDAFDGSTPLQVIERGETDRIWHMIFIVETGEPL